MNARTIGMLATGGTIASHHDGRDWINLPGAQLVGEIDGLAAIARVDVVDVETGPSSNLDVPAMLAIVGHVNEALDSGVDGVVVTHGTDTMEITAFLASLVVGSGKPVVFTGSMRPHSHPQPDGPRNIHDAVILAAAPEAGGVTLCLNGQVHEPHRVRKLDASGLDAFFSVPGGPIGTVVDGVVHLRRGVTAPQTVASPSILESDVSLVTVYPGMADRQLRASVGDARGVVMEGFGDLNLPHHLWGPLHEWATEGRLVVLASGAFTPTVENDLLTMLGVVGAGGLTPQKARVAAMVALSDGRSVDDARGIMERWSRR